MSTLKSYQDLEVWKKSIGLAEKVYRLSAPFPREEKFGMTSQLRRAAASVAANIAEGSERHGTAEFLQFLGIASGSLAETETFLILAQRLEMAPPEQTAPILEQAGDIGRTQTLAAIEKLSEVDFPLALTTDHQSQVTVHGVDVFHPNTGEIRSDNADGIACWFIDTDYNEESFFVRHAYFLGANDPYKALKTTLKAEINQDAWATINSDTSRPFDKPKSGRIAVKVINHLGDEVFRV